MTLRDERPKRCHADAKTGRYYWKPERGIRPLFKTAPLGADRARAYAEARRLNREVDAWRARAGARPVKPVRQGPLTVGQLVSEYRQRGMGQMRERGRAQALYELQRLEAEFGHETAIQVTAARVDDWLDVLKRAAPDTARHLASRARCVFRFGERKALIPAGVNPFREARVGKGGRRAVLARLDELRAIVRLCDAAGRPSLATAFLVGFACVQRIGDVLRLRREHFAGGRLRFVQSKGRRRGPRGTEVGGFAVDMEIPEVVETRLAALPSGWDWLCPVDGANRPWNEKTVSRVFARVLREAIAGDKSLKPLAAIQLRDCRRSGFVHYIVDGQVPIPFICSMSGHSIEAGMAILEHYIPKTPEQADRAVRMAQVKL